MKTTEEAAKEHCKNKQLFTVSKKSFKAGVEFAQRWIPVEEELPPIGELVQIKFKELIGDGKVMFDHDCVIEIEKTKMFACEQCAVKVVAWRPIELK